MNLSVERMMDLNLKYSHINSGIYLIYRREKEFMGSRVGTLEVHIFFEN